MALDLFCINLGVAGSIYRPQSVISCTAASVTNLQLTTSPLTHSLIYTTMSTSLNASLIQLGMFPSGYC
jgi:hypothetical protein